MTSRSSEIRDKSTAIAVFFSHGVGMSTWQRMGMFDREVGYYRALSEQVGPILFITYDHPTAQLAEWLERISPISAAWNSHRLPYQLFGLLAPLLHRKKLAQCRLFKTNQLSGAWTAAIAAWLLRKPLIVRCGYVRSLFAQWAGVGACRRFLGLQLERFSLRRADLVFVATESDRQYLSETHRIAPDRFRIVRNPIDVDRFRPMPEVAKQTGKVVFVGRLNPQKNLHLLIDACRQVPGARLTIAGSGELEAELRQRAAGAEVEFLGTVPNEQLPALLSSAEVFVLPSHYEGSPKTLLEAMACGVAVVGTDVPGIRGLIEDGRNGRLCPPTADALAAAIGGLLGDADLRNRLGANAAELIHATHSQAAIVQAETAYVTSLLCTGKLEHQSQPSYTG